ncbi:MAG: hypothetical protein PHQ75_00370 [Thermoguttaceae bacterium]|nr:hypothetical protein [Thermoguttaceae bacterium]
MDIWSKEVQTMIIVNKTLVNYLLPKVSLAMGSCVVRIPIFEYVGGTTTEPMEKRSAATIPPKY